MLEGVAQLEAQHAVLAEEAVVDLQTMPPRRRQQHTTGRHMRLGGGKGAYRVHEELGSAAVGLASVGHG